MTTEEVDKIINSMDTICTASGSNQTISDVLSQLSTKIPSDMQKTVFAQIKEEVAKVMKDSFDKTRDELAKVAEDKEMLAKVKEKMTNRSDVIENFN